jgi:catechol 2,3-dioxygenase-like lactoylglutathione lyase family enzyme
MALARYKDLCIDAVDAERLSRFWAEGLGLRADPQRPQRLVGATPEHGVWINQVPEPKTVKHRVHLDVHAGSVAEYERLGATVLDGESFPWTVMADPEGGEFCVFVRDKVPAYRLYEVVVDAVDHAAIARWWGEILGASVVHDERGLSWIEDIPGAPFESLDFGPVPEPKTAKNRIHWDVLTDDVDGLVARGATVLRSRDDEIGWTVMADPEGNEFCAFTD